MSRDAAQAFHEQLALVALDLRVRDAEREELVLAEPRLAEVVRIFREQLLDHEIVHFLAVHVPQLLVDVEVREDIEAFLDLFIAFEDGIGREKWRADIVRVLRGHDAGDRMLGHADDGEERGLLRLLLSFL